jgi:AsmA protein
MRALRILAIVVGCVVGLLILGLIALKLLVNPNDFKGRIEAAVQHSTGRELVLTGNLRLSVFPWLAVELGPASLGNPPGFPSGQPFASLQRAALRVRLLPLLRGQLDVGRIEIDGLDLRLLKNAAGAGNWQSAAPAPGAAPAPTGTGTSLREIAGIIVKGSRVSYQDVVATGVNVDIGRVARGVPIPVSWKLALRTAPAAQPIAVSGKATLEYGRNEARLSDLAARVDRSSLRGKAAVTNFATGAMTFDLSVNRLDLDHYLATLSPAGSPPPASAAAQSSALPTGALRTLELDGRLRVGNAIVHGIKLARIDVGLAANHGLLRLAPLAAQLYGGDAAGTVTLDARGAVPVLQLDENLSGVEVQPLAADFARFNRVSGRGNITVNVTARGRTSAAMLASLDGRAAAALAHGAIQGIDLWGAVNSVVALVERHTLAGGVGGGSTRFDVFKASAVITHGIASTRDLDIASGELRVTGQGTTNLVTGVLGYHLLATLLKGPAGQPGKGATLANVPLLVSGTLASPTVRPDQQALARSLAQRELTKHKGAIEKKLGGLLKGLIH